MSDLLAVFDELKEEAKKKIEIEQNVDQVIVVRTNSKKIYHFVNHGISIEEEMQFIGFLRKNNDTIITELLCLWSSKELDVPSWNFRTLLMELHPNNKKAKLVLQGKEGYVIKELSMLV